MIEVEQTDGVWTLTLSRADKANALTRAMLSALADAVGEAAASDPAAVILTGRGRVFSAGADLDEVQDGLATDAVWERASSAIANLKCPTIAALNGTVAGGAFGMVLACDMRVAVIGTKFFYPVMNLGFLPQPSDPKRMRALVGAGRAAMILLAGQKITAEEALSWGLIDRIASDPLAEAHLLAKAAQSASPAHRAAICDMVRG